MGASLIGLSKCMGEKSAADAKWEGPGPGHTDPEAALVVEHLQPAKDVGLAVKLTWGVAVSQRPLTFPGGPVDLPDRPGPLVVSSITG